MPRGKGVKVRPCLVRVVVLRRRLRCPKDFTNTAVPKGSSTVGMLRGGMDKVGHGPKIKGGEIIFCCMTR